MHNVHKYDDDLIQKRSDDTDKRMPVWKMIVIDIILTAVSLGIFSLYQLVIPRAYSDENAIVVATAQNDSNSFVLPGSNDNEESDQNNDNDSNIDSSASTNNNNGNADNINNADNSSNTDNISNSGSGNDNIKSDQTIDTTQPAEKEVINYGNTNTMEIASDTADSKVLSAEEIVTEVNSYKDDKVQFVTNKLELGSGSEKITYYLSDIFVTDVQYLRTAFANGEYGKNLKAEPVEMALENNAFLTITGDFYGNGETGVVIRNGVLYRSDKNDADICVLFTDGVMKTYSPEEFNASEVLKQGAWQAWTFGPQLLDGNGNMLTSFNTTPYLNGAHPRSAIGYVEPGHYVFMVVDGRDEGYSVGVTMSELAQLMAKAGCRSAYNLDGGKSAAMVYDGSYVNQPSQGGRDISDIIYIGE